MGFGVRVSGSLLGGVDRQLCADLVDVVDDVLHAVVRLYNRVRVRASARVRVRARVLGCTMP